MDLKLTDFDVQRMCEKAIAEQLRSEFNSTYSPLQKRFKEGLDRVLTELTPVIDTAIKHGMQAALSSPEFNKRLQDELIKACADKFGGALNGIMRAAAKRAATDSALQEQVVHAVAGIGH